MPTIEGWTLERELSRGGFGTVWRATRPGAPPAAFKLLEPLDSPEALARFEREVEALRRTNHRGVVKVLAAGVHQQRPWLAMELIEGTSLAQLLERDGRLPIERAIWIGARVARALAAVHLAGLVHRDVKPDNVLLARDGEPVLVDFGLVLPLMRERLTEPGVLLGTPGYMAPEQIDFAPEIGPAADLWGLGATLFALLTGAPPYGTGALIAIASRMSAGDPPPPSAKVPGIPAELDALILRCLARRPGDRPPGALDVAVELERMTRRRPAAGSRAPLLAAGLLLAAAGAIAGLLLLRPPPSPALVSPPPAPGPHTLVFQPGPIEGQDTFVQNVGWYVNDNYGAHGVLEVGDRSHRGQNGDFRAWLRFDLVDRLPPDAEVTDARLVLESNGSVPIVLRAHRALAEWREGSSSHDEQLDGIVWDGDLQSGNPGADSGRPDLTQPAFDPEPLAELALTPDQRVFSLPLTAAVRRWLANPATNHGVCLTHAEEGAPWGIGRVAFLSSDWPEVTRRPRLVIEYRGAPPLDREAALAEASRDRRARAREVLARSAPEGPALLRHLSEACCLAPDWSLPFLLRARMFVDRTDALGQPDTDASLYQLDIAFLRPIEDEDVPVARETVIVVCRHVLSSGRRDLHVWLRRILAREGERLMDDELRALVALLER